MAELMALHRCELSIDPTEMGAELLSAAAFREIERFAERLEKRFKAEGVSMKGAGVKPVPTEKLRRFLAEEPDLFRLEVGYTPAIVRS